MELTLEHTLFEVPVDIRDDRYIDMLEVPAGHMAPLHVHHEHDEIVYVLAGEVSIFMPLQQIVARPGDTVRLPMGMPHTHRVEGDRPARWIAWSEPAGYAEFAADTEILGAPGRLP